MDICMHIGESPDLVTWILTCVDIIGLIEMDIQVYIAFNENALNAINAMNAKNAIKAIKVNYMSSVGNLFWYQASP